MNTEEMEDILDPDEFDSRFESYLDHAKNWVYNDDHIPFVRQFILDNLDDLYPKICKEMARFSYYADFERKIVSAMDTVLYPEISALTQIHAFAPLIRSQEWVTHEEMADVVWPDGKYNKYFKPYKLLEKAGLKRRSRRPDDTLGYPTEKLIPLLERYGL